MAEASHATLSASDEHDGLFASLLCVEPEKLSHSFYDKTFLLDDRVLQNLLAAEDQCLPNCSYFDFQPEIKPQMRKVLANWMLDVCEEQHCEEEVFYLAMNFVDRFLSVTPVQKRHFQLLGSACLFVASKLRETLPLTADKLVAYTDNSIALEQLLECEMTVCQVLKWEISVVTPYDFMEQILVRLVGLDADTLDKIRRHSRTFIALCSTEISFVSYPASMIAAGSIMAAACGLLQREWCDAYLLVTKLQNVVSADADCLRSCQEQIERLPLLNDISKKVQMSHSMDGKLNTDTSLLVAKISTAVTPTDVIDVELKC